MIDAHEVMAMYLKRQKPDRPVPDELFKCANLWSWDHAEELAIRDRKILELEKMLANGIGPEDIGTKEDWLPGGVRM